MQIAYFDFYGRPAKVILDEDEVPERCEVYDRRTGSFVPRDDLILDVLGSSGSILIDEEDFQRLLAEVRAKPGSPRPG